MRILVTGGNGQLGTQWVEYLNRREVEFISLPSSDFNLTDHKDTRRVLNNLKPTHLINCAAYTKVDLAEKEKELAFAVNADGVKNLAEFCVHQDVKLIHYSTDYIFSGHRSDEQKFPNGYPEDHTPDPVNAYGASKLAGEEAILKTECDHLIIRTSWLCGKYGNNFVKTMLRLAKSKNQLDVVNDQVGCPSFADDVVEHSWNLIEKQRSGIYHSTSAGKITWFEFAKEIFNQSEINLNLNPVSSEMFKTVAKRPAFSLLSTKKITTIDGIEVKNWKIALNDLLEQLKA